MIKTGFKDSTGKIHEVDEMIKGISSGDYSLIEIMEWEPISITGSEAKKALERAIAATKELEIIKAIKGQKIMPTIVGTKNGKKIATDKITADSNVEIAIKYNGMLYNTTAVAAAETDTDAGTGTGASAGTKTGTESAGTAEKEEPKYTQYWVYKNKIITPENVKILQDAGETCKIIEFSQNAKVAKNFTIDDAKFAQENNVDFTAFWVNNPCSRYATELPKEETIAIVEEAFKKQK